MRHEEAPQKWRMSCPDGYAEMTRYALYPGVALQFNEIHCVYVEEQEEDADEALEINYCLEGRYECELQPGCMVSLAEDGVALSPLGAKHLTSIFPTGHYRGVSLLLTPALAQAALDGPFPELAGSLRRLWGRFCPAGSCFTGQAEATLRGVFRQMYDAPTKLRETYLRVKTLEALTLLCAWQPCRGCCDGYMTRSRMELMRHIREHLQLDLTQELTLAALAQAHGICLTALKQDFMRLYGVTPAAYRRHFRMQQAAQALQETEQSIADIAVMVGYQNPSKFAAAFRAELGLSPAAYRKKARLFGAKAL